MEGEVIIDGGIPRSEAERVSVILGYAAVELDRAGNRFSVQTVSRLTEWYADLDEEYHIHLNEKDFEFWCEFEDEIIEFITDTLPAGWVCELHDGDVLVTEIEQEVYDYKD